MFGMILIEKQPLKTLSCSQPGFTLGRGGGGIDLFEGEPEVEWSNAHKAVWCGWLSGKHWSRLARFLDAGWKPPHTMSLFSNLKAADAAVRAALNGPFREARHVLTQAPHPAALLSVAPDIYVITHPLRRAISQKWTDLLVALLDAGASPRLTCPDRPGTPLHHAATMGWDEGIRLLIGAGADPNERDNTGRTALQAAAELGHCASLRELVIGGAHVCVAGAKGRALLQEITLQRGAIVSGNRLQATVETLLELGAPLGLAEGQRGWRTQKRWAKQGEFSVLARNAAAELLERTMPATDRCYQRERL